MWLIRVSHFQVGALHVPGQIRGWPQAWTGYGKRSGRLKRRDGG